MQQNIHLIALLKVLLYDPLLKLQWQKCQNC